MAFRTLIVALLGLSTTGCAVYGGYGHYGYDRYYTRGYHHVEPYPVYVAPRVYYHDGYRYDRRHHDDGRRDHDRRHDQRRYLPAPQPHNFSHDRRQQQHFDQNRQDQRVDRPRQGRPRADDQGQQPGRHLRRAEGNARGDDWRSAQRRPDVRAQRAQPIRQGQQARDQRRTPQPRHQVPGERAEGHRRDWPARLD